MINFNKLNNNKLIIVILTMVTTQVPALLILGVKMR